MSIPWPAPVPNTDEKRNGRPGSFDFGRTTPAETFQRISPRRRNIDFGRKSFKNYVAVLRFHRRGKGLSIFTNRCMGGQKLRAGHRPAGAIIEPRQKHDLMRIDILRSFLRLRSFEIRLVPPITSRRPIKAGLLIGDMVGRSSSIRSLAAG